VASDPTNRTGANAGEANTKAATLAVVSVIIFFVASVGGAGAIANEADAKAAMLAVVSVFYFVP
jgi:hypothetical protein